MVKRRQRGDPRYNIRVELQIAAGTAGDSDPSEPWKRACSVNISTSGIAVETASSLQMQSRVRLRLRAGERACELSAVVKYCYPVSDWLAFVSGLQFMGVDATGRAIIDDLIRSASS